ncbi:scavenger mRNA decapping enzyme [Thamnocephalis sphaerospora]|uniref:m7GpppX diphosphatase n=1 Tax=Thamnocephalis sphaerospora TaxID=78915 RepID=A0A4P9XTZ2_9FUNG|nr:scavenger mRNA decapping enzyme [Thamnocephalis sphaerospora]|eukprot:RKP09041.1 scavenger mRNA decapping enzyme [Thamnocephalis sphaerospora]
MTSDSAAVNALDLSHFSLTRVLNEDTHSKTVYLLGTLPYSASNGGETRTEPALLIVERLHFTTAEANQLVAKRLTETGSTGQNDVYHWLRGRLRGYASDAADDEWDVKLTVVVPATEAHIRKYTRQERRMIRETPDIYQRVVLPYVEHLPKSRIHWLYNILDGIGEREHVLFNDPDPAHGFMLLPDSKWDKRTMESLYLLCLCHDRTIRSLRDLRAKHLPLLTNIRRQVGQVTSAKYGVPANQLRLFFHYQPSYYHLHVHVTHIQNTQLGGMTVGQAYLLDDVIDMLQLMDDYFQKCTLTYALGQDHPLYAALEEAGATADP